MGILGVTGDSTPEKQQSFKMWVKHHYKVTWNVLNKYKSRPQYYFYYDAFAGPGQYPHPTKQGAIMDGSPLLFRRLSDNSKKHLVLLSDINSHYCNNLKRLGFDNVYCQSCDDFSQSLKLPRHDTYGLAYFDGPGTIPEYEKSFLAMKYLSQKYHFVDLMINFAASSIKRVAYSQHAKTLSIDGHIIDINKKDWVIREPIGRHQWVFMIATNWTAGLTWENKGFYALSSEQGTDIFKRITLNKKDYALWKQKYIQTTMF